MKNIADSAPSISRFLALDVKSKNIFSKYNRTTKDKQIYIKWV